MKKIPGVTAVMPMIETWGMLKSGQYSSHITIQGVDIEEAEAFGYVLSEGRLPEKQGGSTFEIVFGSFTLMNFYNPRTGRDAMDNEGNPKITMENGRFQLTFDDSNIYDYGDYYYEVFI